MQQLLLDVKEKLNRSSYKNEENVRLSLVARILQHLNWNIWNPDEVFTEFPIDGGRSKVDIALFTQPYAVPLYIEIKAADKLQNVSLLIKAENQLRDYNVNLTALFTILTDGNIWRFYYSQEGGTFSQKCFKIINIQNDNIEDVELFFLTFLLKEKIVDGNAKKDAFEYLKLNRKQQHIEESINTAKRLQESNPLLSLVDAIIVVLQEKRIEISNKEILNFLERDSKPNLSTQKIYKKQISRESIIPSSKPTDIYNYNPNTHKLSHTKIITGEIEGETATNWANLLKIVVRKLLKSIPIDEINNSGPVNIREGRISVKGFIFIPKTKYSIQHLSAENTLKAILNLARKFNLKVYIRFMWREKPEAQFPGKYCEIKHP